MASSTPMDTLIPGQPTGPTPAATNKPTSGANTAFDINDGTQDTSIKKLEMKVSGFIDISGLVSNVGVLVLLLGQQSHNEFFAPLVVFLSLSMTLQCVLAVILIVRHTVIEEAHLQGQSQEDIKKYNEKSRKLLTTSSILLMFITVFNVFIVAFAGVAGDRDSSNSTTSS